MANDSSHNTTTTTNHSHHLTFGDLLLFTSFITFFALLTILLCCCCCILLLLQNRLHRRGGDAATSSAATTTTATASEALSKLPVFVFSSSPSFAGGMNGKKLECAVCLAEFKDGEKGRLLPRCNHSFHIECIDAWLDSRSTCPLCRATV